MTAEVRLVLDTSAVKAYAETSMHLGETIVEVVDEGGFIGVPVLCLMEAARTVDPKLAGGLELLVAHEHCVVLPVPADEWRALATLSAVLDRADRAVCLLEAIDRGAYVITADPDGYLAAGGDDLPVIGL